MYKGKSILVYLLVMASMLSYSQNPIVNKFRDSTWFAKGVRFDSAIYLIKGASNGKVLTSDASGRATWQTFTSTGVTQGVLDDSISSIRSIRSVDSVYKKSTNRDLTYFKINGVEYSVSDSIANLTGYALQVSLNDTASVLRGLIPNVSSYATITNLKDSTSTLRGLIDAKQNTLISGTNIKTINSTSLLGSGNIVTPDAQTLTAGTNTLTISGGNTVNLNRKVDTSYQIKNTARDSTCQITVINGISYRSCTKDTISTVTATSTTTFTNKRITARVDSTTSSTTPTINTDNIDTYKLTAQALDITSFTTNLSGTPTDDQILHIVVTATGSHTVTFGSKFEASTVALPTTISTTRSDWYFVWNTATSKWRIGGVW